MSRHRSLLLPRLGLLVLALAASSADPLHTEAAPEGICFTQIERGALGEADAAIHGRVRALITPRTAHDGPQIVTIEVIKAIKGPPAWGTRGQGAPKHLTALLRGREVVDPEKPAVALFAREERGRFVFFLKRHGGGGWVIHAQFRAEGVRGGAKVSALYRVQSLRRVKPIDARARQTLQWLFSQLDDPVLWARENAARELAYFARNHGRFVGDVEREQLRARLRTQLTRGQRRYLDRAHRALRMGPPPRGGLDLPGDAHGRWRRSFERTENPDEQKERLIGWTSRLSDAEGAEERAAIWSDLVWATAYASSVARIAWLREVGDRAPRDLAPAVRRLYAAEEDVAVREAIVRAVGRLGGAGDIAWLRNRLANPRLWNAAVLGLARIRTTEALRLLRVERSRLSAAGETRAQDQVRWLDHLLSEAFPAGDT